MPYWCICQHTFLVAAFSSKQASRRPGYDASHSPAAALQSKGEWEKKVQQHSCSVSVKTAPTRDQSTPPGTLQIRIRINKNKQTNIKAVCPSVSGRSAYSFVLQSWLGTTQPPSHDNLLHTHAHAHTHMHTHAHTHTHTHMYVHRPRRTYDVGSYCLM